MIFPAEATFIRWDSPDGGLKCSWSDHGGFRLFSLFPLPGRKRWIMVRTSDGREICGILGDEKAAREAVFEMMLAGGLPASNESLPASGGSP